MIIENVMDAGENFLEHHGIKGQKWGTRKGGSGGGSSSKSTSVSTTHHLSNEDLKKVVDRMRMEQQFKELSKPPISNGKKYAHGLLQNAGKMAAGAVATAGIALIGKKVTDMASARSASKSIANKHYRPQQGGL